MPSTMIRSKALPPFDVVGISHAVRNGLFLFISGQISLDPEGNIVGIGDVEAQTTRLYEILKSILEDQGGGLNNIVKLTTFYVNKDDFATIAKVRCGYFSGDYRAASSSFAVQALAHPDALVEIEAIAIMDG